MIVWLLADDGWDYTVAIPVSLRLSFHSRLPSADRRRAATDHVSWFFS